MNSVVLVLFKCVFLYLAIASLEIKGFHNLSLVLMVRFSAKAAIFEFRIKEGAGTNENFCFVGVMHSVLPVHPFL